MKRIAWALAWLTAGRLWAGTVEGRLFTPAAVSPIDQAQPAVIWIEGLPPEPTPSVRPVISQKRVQFFPMFMVIVAGQTVDMPNDDDISHSVFSRSPAKPFNLGVYPKGSFKSVRFEKPGLVELFCSLHRQMNAKIFVVPNRHFATSQVVGGYRLDGIPPGRYTLKAWSTLGQAEKMIVVDEKIPAWMNLTLTLPAAPPAKAR